MRTKVIRKALYQKVDEMIDGAIALFIVVGAMRLETSIDQQAAQDEAATRRYLSDLSAAVGAGF